MFGGGRVGLMGALADSVLEAGGEAIGIMPHGLVQREVAHNGLTALHIVDTMHERKALMAEMSDAFVALPGGLGTLEELFETWTWAQLGMHAKPCGLLNVEGYFDGMLQFLDHAVAERFVRDVHRAMVVVESDPEKLLSRFMAYEPPRVVKWINAGTI